MVNQKNKSTILDDIEQNSDAVRFFIENKAAFEYLVKYQDVFRALINSVSVREISILDKDKPCKFRAASEVPFRAVCEANIDGVKVKTIKQCENCVFRQG